MAKTAKEYAEILKAVIEMQIKYIQQDSRYEYSENLQGQEIGLTIALDKIEASQFLIEDWKTERIIRSFFLRKQKIWILQNKTILHLILENSENLESQ